MPGYTHQNLKDLEDAAVGFGLSPNMEARFARDALEGVQTAVSYQRYAPHFRQPFAHRHSEHEELYVVITGGGLMRLDDEIVELRPWDAIRVAPGTVRGFAAGPDGLELLAFGPPAPGDAETQPASWPDRPADREP
jgi:mannose-6-phosphate isomerase-like protein (cupin superfamily)